MESKETRGGTACNAEPTKHYSPIVSVDLIVGRVHIAGRRQSDPHYLLPHVCPTRGFQCIPTRKRPGDLPWLSSTGVMWWTPPPSLATEADYNATKHQQVLR